MDVFSYGVLLLEMITRRIPLPEERVGLIDGIRRVSFKSLVERCLIVEYRHRPTMNDIITELNDTQDMHVWKYDSINSIKVCL